MRRVTLDVSALPNLVFGARAPIWWGVVGLLLIEGTALALVAAAYLYLRLNFEAWPPPGTPPPRLGAATADLVVMLASVLPMALVDRAARREARRPAWLALLVVIALGAVSLALRIPEFHALGCRWDSHAYGSVVWTTLGMHTAHVLTSTVENVLLAALLLAGPLERKHYVDVHVNALYWYFVAGTWTLVYALVFLGARWL